MHSFLQVLRYRPLQQRCSRGLPRHLMRSLSVQHPTLARVIGDCQISASIHKARNEGSIMEILNAYYSASQDKSTPISPVPFNVALYKLHESHGTLAMLNLFNMMQFQLSKMRPDVDSYTAVIHSCVADDKWEQALDVWYQMLKSGCRPNSRVLHRVLQAMGRGLRWKHALETLRDIPQKYSFAADERCYVTVVSACAKAGRPREAIELLDEYERNSKLLGSAYLYTSAMTACTQRGGYFDKSAHEATTQLFDRFVGKGGEPNAVMLGCLLNACAVDGNWFQSLQLLHSGIAEPNIIAYNSVLKACARAGQIDLCLGLLSAMRAKGNSSQPNVVSFTTAVSACASSGRWRDVLVLLDQMKSQGVTPNGFTYTSAANVLVKAGEWKKALMLLDKITEKSSSINQVRYAIAMRAWAVSNIGSSDDIILELFSKLTGVSTTRGVEGLSSSIGVLYGADGPDQMNSTPRSGDLHCYQLALEACARQGYLDTAYLIVDSMLLHGPSPDDRCFNSTIDALSHHISQNSWSNSPDISVNDLLSILDAMVLHNVHPTTVTINAMIKAIGTIGGIEDALDLYNKYFTCLEEESAHTANTNLQKLVPDKITFTTLLWALVLSSREGHRVDARLSYQLMEDAASVRIEVDERFINGVIHVMVQCKQYALVRHIIRSVLKESKLDFSKVVSLMDREEVDDKVTHSVSQLMNSANSECWSCIVENVDFWTCAMKALLPLRGSGTLALTLLASMKEVSCVYPDEDTVSHCIVACCEQAACEVTSSRVRDELLRESISVLHHFLSASSCKNVHYLGLGAIALRNTIRQCCFTQGADNALISLFETEVQELYLNHPTHRDTINKSKQSSY